jgi:orotate phosphoribosyltransferase
MAVAVAAGAAVVGTGAIIDRSGGHPNLRTPFECLVTLMAATYPPETCPLCAEGKPVVKPGSRT